MESLALTAYRSNKYNNLNWGTQIMEPHTLQNLKNQTSMDKFQTGHMLILVKENVKRTSSVRDLRLSQRCC